MAALQARYLIFATRYAPVAIVLRSLVPLVGYANMHVPQSIVAMLPAVAKVAIR